ncbi:hypothetical protein D3C72_2149690 [compost metagenome]
MCGGGAGVGQFRGNRIAAEQTLPALRFIGGAQQRRPGLLQLGLETLHLVLEGPRIDLEQQVPLLHQRTVGKGDPFNLP